MLSDGKRQLLRMEQRALGPIGQSVTEGGVFVAKRSHGGLWYDYSEQGFPILRLTREAALATLEGDGQWRYGWHWEARRA